MINGTISLNESIYLLSQKYCNNHGTFRSKNETDYYCDCDIGFFGFYCNNSGIEIWLNGWKAFQAIFAVVYGIIFCVVVKTFINNLQQESKNVLESCNRIVKTPKYLVILNIMFLSISNNYL